MTTSVRKTHHGARFDGAALGRTLAQHVQAREVILRSLLRTEVSGVEVALIELAASADEMVAEIADSALTALRDASTR